MGNFRHLWGRVSATLLATAVFCPSAARGDYEIHGWENRHEPQGRLSIAPEFLYFTSKTNFAPDGSTYYPANLDSYSRFQFDTHAGYGINPWLSVFGRLSWAKVQVSPLSGSGNGRFGLADSALGLTARVIGDRGAAARIAVDLQVQAELAPYSNTAALQDGTPVLGEGINQYTGGGFVSIPVASTPSGNWTWTNGVAYTRRDGSYGDALQWSTELALSRESEGFFVRGAVQGWHPLQADPLAQTPISALAPAGSGGSFATGSTHPQLLTVRAQGGYQLDPRLSLNLQLASGISGASAAQGLTIAGGATLRFGAVDSRPSASKSASEYGKANQGFVDYHFEARVTRTNDRLNLIKIDKGSNDGVEPGQIFDVFAAKAGGEAREAVARAKVQSVKPDEAALQVIEYFQEVWIEEGFLVKRPVE